MNENKKEIISLSRDTIAMMVPSGARIMLHAGTEVSITQALGNAFTVNVFGNLARIDSKDADALGKEIKDPLADLPEDASAEDRVMAMLKMVFDPEIPVNIVDLGLIYTCGVNEVEAGQYIVNICMTLTAPGCGMGPVIVADAKEKVLALPEVNEVNIEMVFDPPWDRSMMSEVAQLELGVL
ncbi:MAG: putative Fe-S cluster assembly protein SufT [Coxiellaceae bacterium]|nr:putative Fe-S cluster assembly protein SufT [Coxiellaceae bacterium]